MKLIAIIIIIITIIGVFLGPQDKKAPSIDNKKKYCCEMEYRFFTHMNSHVSEPLL